MKSNIVMSGICGFFLILMPIFGFAQDMESSGPFQRGNTYIRYRLTPDALSSQDLNTLTASEDITLTINRQDIDTIDAYFDLAPERRLHNLTPGAETPHLFEAKWTPEIPPHQRTFSLRATDTASSLNTLVAWWKIGKIALTLGYDRFHPSTTSFDLSDDLANRLLHGQLRLPLGESGFSLGASLGMYASSAFKWAKHTFDPRRFDLENLFDGTGASAHTAYAASGTQADDLSASTMTVGPQQAVVGTMHVTGAVKGIDVFTKVGFASGTQDQRSEIMTDELPVANFYALGGAKYRIGQVTLGLEAGFENGTDLIEEDSSDSLGFENDFLIDTLLESDAVSEHSPDNTAYAALSAAMNPTEQMTVEGAFRYIQPFHDGKTTDIYGFEVDGAFRYSLTNYLKCLVKAGMATLNDSWENSQYKVINQIELTY